VISGSRLRSADGRDSVDLGTGASITIEAAVKPTRFVRRADGPAFLSRVREKFELPGDAGRPGVGGTN
jgi:NAD kinase